MARFGDVALDDRVDGRAGNALSFEVDGGRAAQSVREEQSLVVDGVSVGRGAVEGVVDGIGAEGGAPEERRLAPRLTRVGRTKHVQQLLHCVLALQTDDGRLATGQVLEVKVKHSCVLQRDANTTMNNTRQINGGVLIVLHLLVVFRNDTPNELVGEDSLTPGDDAESLVRDSLQDFRQMLRSDVRLDHENARDESLACNTTSKLQEHVASNYGRTRRINHAPASIVLNRFSSANSGRTSLTFVWRVGRFCTDEGF